MACCSVCVAVLLGIFVFIGLLIKKIYSKLFKIPPLPKLDEKQWWGPGLPPSKEDESVKTFKINVSDEVLKDLQSRLQIARPFTPPLEGIQQQYGMNTDLLTEIIEFWKTKYNWHEREQFLNKFPQYTTNIQGLDIHFLHVKPTETNGLKVLPLLLLHGWPGSVREFYEMIPLMITPQKGRNFVFEVIIPSLPGYGFSQGAAKPGLGTAQMAVIFKNLMKRLGFDKYYIQGGDWGSAIVSNMATLYPDHILGAHINSTFVNTALSRVKLLLGTLNRRWIVEKEHEDSVYPLSKMFHAILLESGYFHIQATKPDTVGVGLTDSPVGLAAYILEKFTTWTNPEWKNREDGGLTLRYSYEQLLDNVMLYWINGCITTSMRLYAEHFSKAHRCLKLDRIPIKVPMACARFKKDVVCQPNTILKEKYPILLQTNDYSDGGHFAALEVPQVLADDIWSAAEKFEAYYKKFN